MSIYRALLPAVLLCLSAQLWAGQKVDLDYRVKFLPDSDQAEVSLTLADTARIYGLTFNLGKRGAYSDFVADGQWQQSSPEQGQWLPLSAPGAAPAPAAQADAPAPVADEPVEPADEPVPEALSADLKRRCMMAEAEQQRHERFAMMRRNIQKMEAMATE